MNDASFGVRLFDYTTKLSIFFIVIVALNTITKGMRTLVRFSILHKAFGVGPAERNEQKFSRNVLLISKPLNKS